jgi:glutamate-1-semialdehyde 2,1-aminomutase
MIRTESNSAFADACRLIPGGVNSPARAFGAVGGKPIFFDRAEGAYLYDLDGNRYIDYVGSWGPMILGHAHPGVIEAVTRAAARGTSFGAPTLAETELAELIIEAVPSVEKVRLVSSGTEATMSAIRLARGATGRDKIIKFAGNYHGHVDSLLVAAGSSAATLGVPSSPGVTRGTTQDTIVLEYNDAKTLRTNVVEAAGSIAAVIFEPVVGNMGVVAPNEDFLAVLRDAQSHGVLLVCDEVMTGFRVAYAGAQSFLGLHPDLTTFGKIVGGGLPVGAYGGRADLMDQVLPAGRIFQAGTLSGNPLATAAGIATLLALRDDPPYDRLDRLAARLEQSVLEAARETGLPLVSGRVGSMLTFFLHSLPVTGWESASRCDTNRFAQFFWGLADRGIYWPCSQFEAAFLSTAHSEEDIEATIQAARDALRELNI